MRWTWLANVLLGLGKFFIQLGRAIGREEANHAANQEQKARIERARRAGDNPADELYDPYRRD